MYSNELLRRIHTLRRILLSTRMACVMSPCARSSFISFLCVQVSADGECHQTNVPGMELFSPAKEILWFDAANRHYTHARPETLVRIWKWSAHFARPVHVTIKCSLFSWTFFRMAAHFGLLLRRINLRRELKARDLRRNGRERRRKHA